jgi:hypothetical protein
VVIVVIVCAAVYLLIQAPGPAEEPEKPASIEMPIEAITIALATSEGVSTDNVEVQFCELSSETDNDHFAVGAIVTGNKSIVFSFENSTGQITEENSYTASGDEVQAVAILEKQLSKFTGNKIVPGWFESEPGGYSFKYYDGYSARFQRWLWGVGTVNLDNLSVVWGSHSV